MLAAADGRAIGTSVRVVVTRADRLGEAGAAVDGLIREVDEACSRFREDSELRRIQARPGAEAQLSPLLASLLAAALRGAELSDGAVDPTVGTAVRAAGYEGDFASVAAEGGPISLTVRPVPGWRRIRLDPARRTVVIPPGVEVDLGSTAKALAADLAATRALAAIGGGGGVLVSLGGDIAVAGDAPEGGWRIQVADDSDAPITADGETVTVTAGGVATSSTAVRRWTRGGVVLHHIIDPATGLPAAGPWRTVTVVAANCLDANIAATAAVVRGASAVAWLESLRLPSRLVGHDGAVTRAAGWPERRWRSP
ncbi:MAG TPA: FAD:protein FMN transferase [Candidatus Dormibacteraeota bacterium]|jgi:thiamine biosynthesis lipoprotein